MWITLTTGMSGSGKSVALNVPEDTDYYYVDNLPTQFILKLARYLTDQGYTHLGMATDIHSRESLRKAPKTITMPHKEHDVCMLFLTTSTTMLVQRYSKTRRRYPLPIRNGRLDIATSVQAVAKGLDISLIETIEMERELFSPLADPAHRIDISTLHTSALCAYIKGFISNEPHDITLMLEPFGSKHGVSTDADLVFDVRSLPNPCYDTQLRSFTGRDQPIIDFPQSQSMILAMAEDVRAYVERWLPSLTANDHSYLTVVIGCTDGQHRFVYIVE